MDCEDTSVTEHGVQGVNYDTVESDHVEDRSIFPTHFAYFAQSGRLDLANNTVYQSTRPLFPFHDLLNYFATPYTDWAMAVEPDVRPLSPADIVAEEYGSTTTAEVMQNLERALNVSCLYLSSPQWLLVIVRGITRIHSL